MSVNITVYSVANTASKTITFDFVQDYLVAQGGAAGEISVESFFKITTSAKDTSNLSYPVKIVKTMASPDLALVDKQSANNAYSGSAYTTIKEMIVDYTYDYINGHTVGEGGSSCVAKAPMKFS